LHQEVRNKSIRACAVLCAGGDRNGAAAAATVTVLRSERALSPSEVRPTSQFPFVSIWKTAETNAFGTLQRTGTHKPSQK